LKQFIQRYDYKSALIIVKGLPAVIRKILDISSARLDFDFDRSYRLLLELRQLNKEKRIYAGLNNLLKRDLSPEKKMEELYYHMEIKLKNNEYHDFLSRFYCFYDNYMHLILKRFGYHIFELETEKKRVKAHDEFIEPNQALKEHLENHKRKLDYKGNPSTMVRYFIAEFFYKDDEKFKNIAEINKKFEKIIEKRNKTIIAHKLEGVTEKDFSALYDSKDFIGEILNGIKSFLDFIGIQPDSNIFERINGIILENLKAGPSPETCT
jgi:hypothetical protein